MLRTEPTLVFLTVVEVKFVDRGSELYFLPLAVATDARADQLLKSGASTVIARLNGSNGQAVLHDALGDDAQALLALMAARGECVTQSGVVRGSRTSAYAELRGPDESPLKLERGAATSSNSTVICDNRLMLKVFRRLEPGPNPDVELGLFLTERTEFRRVPRTAGTLEYRTPGWGATSLGILQELVHNEGDGWTRSQAELRRYYESAAAQTQMPAELRGDGRTLTELAANEPPAAIMDLAGPFLRAAATLGGRTAQLHLALASELREPAFAAEPLTAADLSELSESMHIMSRKTLAALEENLGRLTAPVREQAHRLLANRARLAGRMTDLFAMDIVAAKIRVHGDYHLGQVLWVENDFVIIDFEGEPARSISERRAKQSPLKDVAGMLRSFSYAAYAGLFHFTQDRPQDFDRLEPWAKSWERWASAAFLGKYLASASGAPFLPADATHLLALLETYLLDKAVYELHYELNNRPVMVRIPLIGILSLL